MHKFTLKQLKYFEALSLTGHFGKAAEACSISQPALSMQIRELEGTLGSPLFERTAKQVQLTSFGEEFSERAFAILRSADELSDLARARKNQFAGKIRIGIIPTIAPYLLPKLIGNITHQHPNLDVHIRETQTQVLIEELADGKLDTAILALPISESTLTEVALFEEDFVLVRPFEDKDNPVPNAEALSKMRLLLLEEGHCFRDQALSFCNVKSGLPKDGMDGSSLTTLVQMVSAGIGVTLIPEMAVPIETRLAEVAIARFTKLAPRRSIGMVWRNTTPLVEQLSLISEIVRESAKA